MKLFFGSALLVLCIWITSEAKKIPIRHGPIRSPTCRRQIKCNTSNGQPICAAPVFDSEPGNLRTFSSTCWLQNYNCNHPNSRYEMVYNQTCSPNIPITQTCTSRCTRNYKPVCAEPLSGNGEIKQFSNICGLSDYNCRHRKGLYQVAYNGTCTPNIPIPSVCTRFCTLIYKPVCAIPVLGNGHEMDFSNICLLGSYNCRNRNKLYKNIYNGTCDENYEQDSSYSSSSESGSRSDNYSNNKSDRRGDIYEKRAVAEDE